jgi:transcriptional regulator with XRE-family HTH domain
MAIAAHFENTTTDNRAPRRQLRLEAAARTPGGTTTQVLIHNVSESGLLIETSAKLAEAERFDVVLPDGGPTAAIVVWHSVKLYGCRFAEPLAAWELDALQRRSEAEQQAEQQAEPAAPAPQPSQLETLPVRLARLRKQQGLTLDMLAELVGVSKPTVWAWEHGKTRPAEARLAALAAQLGVCEADLRTGRDIGALELALAKAREQVAVAFGIDQARVKIIIEV